MKNEYARDDYDEQRWEDDGGKIPPAGNELGRAWEMRRTLDSVCDQAVPPQIAALLLGWHRATVYRYMRDRKLEFVRRGKRQRWVTVRAILDEIEKQYGPTATYDALEKLRRMNCRTSRNRRRPPQ